jgi:hypothetical protein
MYLLIVFNTLVFVLLSALHVYWAVGGQWGAAVSIPAKPSGEVLFRPRAAETLVVAGGLLLFAWLTWAQQHIRPWEDYQTYIRYGNWAITAIFLLRATGEFRYVGFFKKITNTPFARYDSRYYAPVSLLIALVSLAINWLEGIVK